MIETRIDGGIFEIVIDNAPVNALCAHMQQALSAAVASAHAHQSVEAILIRGAGKGFSGGADISEFDRAVEHSLPRALDAIEASLKPVVAAVHGFALGGGLELALACHYRIATPDAKLGLPEVTLGLLPAAGGTQRLPRLVGIEAALTIIALGAPIDGRRALEIELIDRLADPSDLIAQAKAFARSLGQARPTRGLHVAGDTGAIARFAAKHRAKLEGREAPKACLQAVTAAVGGNFDEGQALEHELFNQLVKGDQSRSLRHAFFAERAAAKIDALPNDVLPREVGHVGIVGAGTMGGGIAMTFLSAGMPVTLADMDQAALDRGLEVIRRNYDASVAKGRLTGKQVSQAMDLLAPTLDFAALAQCDLIIEAVYEDMEVKTGLFARLDTIARSGAILASNTSFLSIDQIALATSRPQDVLGLHFFSPANIMKLVEVVRGVKTSPEVLATGMALSSRIGKVPVVSGVCHGFIGNRMLTPRQDNADRLLLEGAMPDQIDRVHTAFGMPMGPFQMMDLAGLDIGWHRDPTRSETVQEALCAMRRWGQKTGAGYYDYDDKRRPTPSDIVSSTIEGFRRREGLVARAISDDEITARTLFTVVNEGAKILEEGIAQRASDIDVVWLHGYGWPRHKGGPMFWAQQIGFDTVVNGLNRYAASLGEDFVLSPLLKRCAAGKAALYPAVA